MASSASGCVNCSRPGPPKFKHRSGSVIVWLVKMSPPNCGGVFVSATAVQIPLAVFLMSVERKMKTGTFVN